MCSAGQACDCTLHYALDMVILLRRWGLLFMIFVLVTESENCNLVCELSRPTVTYYQVTLWTSSQNEIDCLGL